MTDEKPKPPRWWSIDRRRKRAATYARVNSGDWTSIAQFQGEIEKTRARLEADGGVDFEVSVESSCDCEYCDVDVRVRAYRPLTAEELTEVEKENLAEEARGRAARRAQYEKLKAEFEPEGT